MYSLYEQSLSCTASSVRQFSKDSGSSVSSDVSYILFFMDKLISFHLNLEKKLSDLKLCPGKLVVMEST